MTIMSWYRDASITELSSPCALLPVSIDAKAEEQSTACDGQVDLKVWGHIMKDQ